MSNLQIKTVHEASAVSEKKGVFNGMYLQGGKLYSSSDRERPVLDGVEKVSAGLYFNQIFLADGRFFVYTLDGKQISSGEQYSALVGCFYVFSGEELEINADFELAKGHGLKVVDAAGVVLHKNVRGFMPLDRKFHLVRRENGDWVLCDGNGSVVRGLRKLNLTVGEKSIFIDERGKMHLDAWSIHCYDILRF